jgi:phenylalanyl-tRNA synthetase alpha chain
MSNASDLETLQREFDESLASISDVKALTELRNAWLAKKGGRVTAALAALRDLPPEEKPAFGQQVNVLKQHVEAALKARQAELESAATAEQLSADAIDPTLPGPRPDIGGLHPIRLIQDEIEEIFTGLGYSVMHGPEIEDEHHNFEALNVPADHPARDDQDTFYLIGHLLRTHTSPVQIRTMEGSQPPVRIICPGRVYRRDWDASHSPMFHQFEGLVVGEDVSLADLKGTLDLFFKRLLGEDVKTRVRPSFFPFTEPSAEVDISCRICGAEGCPACKGTGWIEVMGSGMVHPKVFEAVGWDPERVQGFAFGGGIDRMAMLKYGVPNIHVFFENDVRFLRQYR